jgi:O-methyltransferase involved in polyketide biosynthesis
MRPEPEKRVKIELTAEKKTLLITLYAKAADYRSKRSILKDKMAYEIVSRLDYDYGQANKSGHDDIIVVRAKQFDEWVTAFIKAHEDSVVLNLGCGLDTRVTRIAPPPTVDWFDVDYPEVIELRRNFYSDSAHYHMIASSVTAEGWLDEVPGDRPVMIIAEGLLEYLEERDVKVLLNRLTDHLGHGQIAFDVMNSFAIKGGRNELKRTMGAEHKWAVDDINDVDRLDPKLERIEALPLFKSRYVRELGVKDRLLYDGLSTVPPFNSMMRLLLYQF